MIPRLLVPVKLSPTAATPAEGRRRTFTILDERSVIPAEMPIKPLEVETKIPAHFPLEVIGRRFLVQREASVGTLEMPTKGQTLLSTDADERMAVPVDARPAEFSAESSLPIEVLDQEDLVSADVFTTGEVKFLPREVSSPPRDWSWIVPTSSVAAHILLVLVMLGLALLFPHREPTQAELEAASRDLGVVYLPGSMFNQPKPSPKPAGPGDKLRVDPGMMKKFAPEIAPSPAPAPVTQPETPSPRPARELPSAPVPQIPQQPNGPPPASHPSPIIDSVKPVPDTPTPLLKLPAPSASRALEESTRGASSRGGSSGATFGGTVPRGSGGLGSNGGGGGGGGEGYMGGAVQMLTPDEGLDWSSYLARVVASVKRYWYSAMPESARMGDRGRVVIDFKIMRDGSVPMPEPVLRMGSGKEPLDRAALASIRGASPFEPLPTAFSGPYIELRFIFLYNLPLDAAQ
ncbi:MAG TPA: TonB family protein [Candidatus Acidoferrales bacterium]|nr:TonB family protein [Candidatus Acidoferrales bacterium]